MNSEKDTGRAAGGFGSLYRHGSARVAVAIPRVTVADPASNAEQIIALARQAAGEHAVLTVFPELSLSSYTADDLFTRTHCRMPCWTRCGAWSRPAPACEPHW